MSMGAICFTSCGSNGGCWVVLVFLSLFLGGEKVFFFHTRLTTKKSYTTCTQKTTTASYAYFYNQATLSSWRLLPR